MPYGAKHILNKLVSQRQRLCCLFPAQCYSFRGNSQGFSTRGHTMLSALEYGNVESHLPVLTQEIFSAAW